MWKLQTKTDEKRTYVNSTTGSSCKTSKVYTDKEGNNWYSFDDLMSLPYTRNFAATKISSLYALGLTKDDLTNHITGLKTLLNSNDKEKYQKAYANVLDFESKVTSATDPIRQQTALVPVYYLLNDEAIDSFEQGLQMKKMGLLEADPEMHSFFLRRLLEATADFLQHLNLHSQTVSQPLSEPLALSQ